MANTSDVTIEDLVEHLPQERRKEFNRIYYGREDFDSLGLTPHTLKSAEELNLDVRAFRFSAALEETRTPRVVRVGLVQHGIAIPTTEDIADQRSAIHKKVEKIIDLASVEGVNVVCLQEAWPMPFALCTGEKVPWLRFAESAEEGPSTKFLQQIAIKYRIVIVSPILERDADDKIWNTAVVISDLGQVIGKHRKNHLPSRGSFDETAWYEPGDTGHPVFDTRFGRIAVNICYGRHHPQNWLMFALNGAELVFSPAATVARFGEAFWGIEARSAAVANGYFTCSINRVGTETFNTGNSTVTRSYYGSSYITAPDGVRTPGLSRVKEGLLIGELDLNMCRQVKDKWGFNITRRMDLYAKALTNHCHYHV